MPRTPAPLSSQQTTQEIANALRFLAIDATSRAQSGHPGMPMGMADIAAVLFAEFLNFASQTPHWPNRDRFILSNGHGSMLHYGLLHLFGYGLSIDDIKNFRQAGSNTPGHPEFGHTTGIETTTGPLGQGFATGVGMALAQEVFAAQTHPQTNTALFNNKTYVCVGDGCLMEGISHEAAELAGALRLKNLIVLFDDNHISIDGDTQITTVTDICARFNAYGWATTKADGHNHSSIRKALAWAQQQEKPAFIAFRTHIGFGSPTLQGTAKAHGSPLSEEEVANTRKALGWPHPAFFIPNNVYTACQKAADRGQTKAEEWQKAFSALPQTLRQEITQRLSGHRSDASHKALAAYKAQLPQAKPLATREASGLCVDIIAETDNCFISGSADLTSSNNTKPKNYAPVLYGKFEGNYIHYGVREHAMGAIMNGLSLYGGFRPISGTFLVFTDYLRPSIRLSALMGRQVVYVLTHDSIGLGEDGPTHQPIEHLAMLRATPNLYTWRPADLIETVECWQAIGQITNAPHALALSRHKLPAVRTTHKAENMAARGAYVLREEEGPLQGIFIATGSEVHLAVAAHEHLKAKGLATRVVSMPSVEAFLAQPPAYQSSVLPECCQARVVIEAASSFGWHRFASQGALITIDRFGASAPAEVLFEQFGFTEAHITQAMQTLLTKKESLKRDDS